MTAVHIHNTLTGELAELKPIAGAAGPVTFYTCGPTVYDDAHIGNFRSFLNADILRRTIELTGTHVDDNLPLFIEWLENFLELFNKLLFLRQILG